MQNLYTSEEKMPGMMRRLLRCLSMTGSPATLEFYGLREFPGNMAYN
jgi:hypothetical protein